MLQPKKYPPAEEATDDDDDDEWEVEVCSTVCLNDVLQSEGARCKHGSVWCNTHQQITPDYSCCYYH